MRFNVPQFIDVEDKIFGPLTFRQFAYLAGGGGLCYIIFKILPWYFSFPLMIGIGALSLGLAFYKYNGKPLLNLIESMFSYFVRDRLYIWKKEKAKSKKDTTAQKTIDEKKRAIPVITESKLHDISWGLDVLDSKKD